MKRIVRQLSLRMGEKLAAREGVVEVNNLLLSAVVE